MESNVPAVSRKWVSTSSDQLRVATYNILAPSYCNKNTYATAEVLEWHQRRDRLVQQIRAVDADVLAMQEVEDYGHFEKSLGDTHEGFFGERGGRNETHEGCALFWRKQSITCVERLRVDLNEVTQYADVRERLDDKGISRLVRNNVALVAALVQGDRKWIVATVHTTWDPKNMDIKLLQVRLTADRIEEVAARAFPGVTDVSVVWMGDFNTLPDDGVFRLITRGSVERLEGFAWLPELRIARPYRSAYASVGHPPTTFTPSFTACIDYVFVSSSVHVASVLDIAAPKGATCPNATEPSDHVQLSAMVHQ